MNAFIPRDFKTLVGSTLPALALAGGLSAAWADDDPKDAASQPATSRPLLPATHPATPSPLPPSMPVMPMSGFRG